MLEDDNKRFLIISFYCLFYQYGCSFCWKLPGCGRYSPKFCVRVCLTVLLNVNLLRRKLQDLPHPFPELKRPSSFLIQWLFDLVCSLPQLFGRWMSLVNVKITREIDKFCGLIYFSVKIIPFTKARYERKFPCETIFQLSINLWDIRIKSNMAGNSNSRKINQHEINTVFFALLNFRNATVATTTRCQQTSVANSRTKGSQAAGIKEKPHPEAEIST